LCFLLYNIDNFYNIPHRRIWYIVNYLPLTLIFNYLVINYLTFYGLYHNWKAPLITCVAEGGSRSRNRFLRPYIRTSKAILLSVICNSNSFQSILFKLCTVFVYILKMCTSYYRLIWRFFSYIFCMLNLVILYHYMSWTVPSWCNLNLQQCSINIIQTLHSVCIHIEDMHLLLWADLTIFFFNFLYVENHYMTLMVPSWCNLKL
jgi:hypothetical protein